MAFKNRTGAVLGVAIVAIVGGATIAVGQNAEALPPRGDFALTFSLVDTTGGTPVMIGPDRMARAVNQVAHLFNDEGPGSFLHYAVGSCASFEIVDVAANTIEVTGYCTYRDADGDRAFERFATDGAVALDAVTMTSEWLGGTGKYEDLTGTFATEAYGEIQNGAATLVGGRKTGSYEIAGAETPVTPPAASGGPTPEETAALMAALMVEGEDGFNRNCAGCHGREGEGGAGPELAGNRFLAQVGGVIGQILLGNEDHGMPPFAGVLNDRQIAAIGTYIRNSWGNAYGIINETAVANRR